jgi:hypothetical protein
MIQQSQVLKKKTILKNMRDSPSNKLVSECASSRRQDSERSANNRSNSKLSMPTRRTRSIVRGKNRDSGSKSRRDSSRKNT